MREWINTRLDEIGETKSGLGRHLGLPFARISEMISGKRDIKASEVTPIAEFLKLSPTGVLSLIQNPKLDFDTIEKHSSNSQNSIGIDELTRFAIEQAGDIIWKISSRDSRINIDPDKFREVVVSTVEAAVLEKVESGHLAPDFTDNIVKFQIRKI